MTDNNALFRDPNITAVLLPDGWHAVNAGTFARLPSAWGVGTDYRFGAATGAWLAGPLSAVQAVQYGGHHPHPGHQRDVILAGVAAWAAGQPRVTVDLEDLDAAAEDSE